MRVTETTTYTIELYPSDQESLSRYLTEAMSVDRSPQLQDLMLCFKENPATLTQDQAHLLVGMVQNDVTGTGKFDKVRKIVFDNLCHINYRSAS